MSTNIRTIKDNDGNVFYPQTDLHAIVDNGVPVGDVDVAPTFNSKKLINSGGVYNQYVYEFVNHGFINKLNGNFTSSNDFDSTDFIPVFEGLQYKIYSFVNSGSVAVIAFYDENKTFISSLSRSDSQQKITDGIIPNRTYYIRCSTNNWSGYTNSVAIFANNGIADALKYASQKCIKKETSADGYIEFTVPINQYVVDNSDYQDHLIDNETNIIDVNCYLKLPNSYTSYGKPSKLVMMCHGAGQSDISGFMNEPNYNNLVNEFTSHEYAVFDCSGYANTTYGCNFWGAPKGVSAWRKAYDYIVDNYNVERVISIYGFSMGGLTVMNLLNSEFPNVKCVALGSPVLDLYKCWNGGVQSQITTAYGVNVWNQELYAGNNPISNIFTYNSLDYFRKKLPPLKIWYGGTEDGTVLSYVDKSDAILIVNAIRNSNGIAYYREITGGGHSICYGGNANVNQEIRMFFDRYSY